MDFFVRNLFKGTTKTIAKNFINYLIGNYLSDELHESQIELIDNFAQCNNICINLKFVNDALKAANLPISLLFGRIGIIRIYLPWKRGDKKLFLEIEELELSFGPSQRAGAPDKTDVLFGSMVESIISMQKSLSEEDFSGLIFQDTNSGKNVNAFISKWISKFNLCFIKTRINLESLPFQSGEQQFCRFICDITEINLETKENDTESINSTSLLGILMQNNLEISGISLWWEAAIHKPKSQMQMDDSVQSFSSQSDQNKMLYGAQIMSIQGSININYTLLVNSSTPEFEVCCFIPQIDVLLAPLEIHWLQLIMEQCMPSNEELQDPSLAKNVKMTSSQFESFFPNHGDDRSVSQRSQNLESVYYDTSSTADYDSLINLDDVPLDNSDDENSYDNSYYQGLSASSVSSRAHTVTNSTTSTLYRRTPRPNSNKYLDNDASTCASLATNFTIFDKDGKINTNLKATCTIETIAIKVLHQNPKNEFLNYLDYPDDEEQARQNYFNKWRSISQEFFKTIQQEQQKMTTCNALSLDHVRSIHHENVEGNYFSLFSKETVLSFLTKKFKDDIHHTLEFSSDQVSVAEIICKTCSFGISSDTFELLDIQVPELPTAHLHHQTEKKSLQKAISIKCEYNMSNQSDVTLQVQLGQCELGVDLSLQDRLKPITQNDLLLEHLPQSWSSSSLGANTYSFTTKQPPSQDYRLSSVSVINIVRLSVNIHVPIVNLIDDIPYYWQNRMLNHESIRITIDTPCRIITKTSATALLKHETKQHQSHHFYSDDSEDPVMNDNSNFMMEVYTDKIDVSLYSETIGNVPILIIYNERDDPIPIIHIKTKRIGENLEDTSPKDYYNINDSFSSIYMQPFISILTPSDSSKPQHHSKKTRKLKYPKPQSNNKPYCTKESTGNDGKRFIYEPQDEKTIYNYMKKSINNSMLEIEVKPTLVVGMIQNKDDLQVLYHRLCFDLVLWESNYDKSRNNIVINCHNIDKPIPDPSSSPRKSHNPSLSSKRSCKKPRKKKEINWSVIESDEDESEEEDRCNDDDDDEDEDEDAYNNEDDKTVSDDKKEMKCFEPKKFTLKVNADLMKICLRNRDDNNKSETVCWLDNAIIFTDSNVIFDNDIESQSIVIVSAESACVFQADNVLDPCDFDSLAQMDKDSLETSHNSVLIPQPLEFSNIDSYSNLATEPYNMFWFIMDSKVSAMRKSRQKRSKYHQKSSSILTGTLNKFCVKHTYHQSSTNQNDSTKSTNKNANSAKNSFDWLIDLSELLAVDNPIITGYTMPDTETIVHLHFKQGCADLSFTNSPMSLLAFINRSQLEFTFNTTDSYWLNCAVELSGSQLFIRQANQSNPPSSHNISNPTILNMGYVFIADLGNLDIKFNKMGTIKFDTNQPPICKLELTNTELNLHLCNDSLQLIIAGLSALMPSESSDSRQHTSAGSHTKPRDSIITQDNITQQHTESFSTKTLSELNNGDLNQLMTDAMKDMTISHNTDNAGIGNRMRITNERSQHDRKCRLKLASISDEFLLVTDRSWSVSEEVRNVDPSASLTVHLSVVKDHFKLVNIEDQYTNLNRLICRDGMSSFNPIASVGANSLIVHDFSIGLHLYAGRDFKSDENKAGMQNKNSPSNKSDLSESQKKMRSRMTNSMNVRFQRFAESHEMSSMTTSVYNNSLQTEDDPSLTINSPSSEYDMYFGGKKSIADLLRTGGYNRKLKECYNLKLCKIFFRYDDYNLGPGHTKGPNYPSKRCTDYSSFLMQPEPLSRRIVFLVNSIELHSHNQLSQVNKNFYMDTDAKNWYDPRAPMVKLRMLYFMMDPEEDVLSEECDIKLSIQPICLNIDQELVSFCEDFQRYFVSLAATTTAPVSSSKKLSVQTPPKRDTLIVHCSSPGNSPIKSSPNELSLGQGGGIDSISGSSPLSKSSTTRAPAFDEMLNHHRFHDESATGMSKPRRNSTSKKKGNGAVFIRSFYLFPDVSVRLDYNGTRVDLSKGIGRGLLYILMQLNNAVLTIRRRKYQEGITGYENLINLLVQDVWQEVCGQLSSILTRLGPMAEISDILSGVYDLFNMPYQHYRTQANLIEGIKLGTRSITTGSLWAALTLISKGLRLFQKMAETTYELVSTCEDEMDHDSPVEVRILPARPLSSRSRATTIHNLPRPHRLLKLARQMPAALASPVLAACEATGTLVDGLRYQLRPDTKHDDELKWKL